MERMSEPSRQREGEMIERQSSREEEKWERQNGVYR